MVRTFGATGGGLALLLVLAGTVWGQSERPWTRFFGTKTAEKVPAKNPALEARRLAEIQVEIAWLADPLTFPYFLEARGGSAGLEVKGYVPNRTIHDHALNLARVYSALPVIDALKEHPSLLVKPGLMAPQQLQISVASALREALPRHASQLQIQCGREGKVVISGPVPTQEERLIVSHALRRLYGCASVQNLTRVPLESVAPPVANKPAEPKGKSPAVAHAPVPPPLAPPPEKSSAPMSTSLQPTVPVQEAPAAPEPEKKALTPSAAPPVPASPAVAARLQKQIEKACVGVKEVRVEVISPAEFRIHLTAGTEEQVGTFAAQIFAIPELQNYKADLQFKVAP
jgi:hypothetical protein